MTLRVSLLSLLIVTVWTLSATAIIPPLPEGRLEQDADLIVMAKAVKISPVGEVKKDHCYSWQTYETRLRIESTIKGKAEGKEIVVIYRSRIKTNDKRCVGGANSYFLAKDTLYRLFLQRSINKKTKKITYRFYHWQCVST